MSALLAGLALGVPALVPMGQPPFISLYTEAAALLGWGLWLAWWWPTLPRGARGSGWRQQPALLAALAALALLLASVAASVLWRGLPLAIGVRLGGILLGATVVLWVGATLTCAPGGLAAHPLTRQFLAALMVVGLANAAVALLQSLGLDGPWEPQGADGRASGQLGQPNLLGTQLLWAFGALVLWLRIGRPIPKPTEPPIQPTRHIPWPPHIPRWAAPAALALAAALVASASRTATLASLCLALWGLVDSGLHRRLRGLLIALPLLLVLGWAALAAWQQHGGPVYAGTGLLNKADPTSARWRLWQQCVLLVAQQPWSGVGVGQFNFAWTLTPMPDLPRSAGYAFTHAHNLFVQWAVELGLPLTLLVSGLLGWPLWDAARRTRLVARHRLAGERAAAHGTRKGTVGQADQVAPAASANDILVSDVADRLLRRGLLALLGVVLVHSQLEYPLWHVNFLLPTAFMMGLLVGRPRACAVANTDHTEHTHRATQTPDGHQTQRTGFPLWPLLMAAAAAWTLHDYRPLAAVYHPPPGAPALDQRVSVARQSLLFGHLGDRFAATLAPAGQRQLPPFDRVVHEMLDRRLLTLWAQAFAEKGQVDQARFLAARLREFDDPAAQDFFKTCAQQPQLFQCQAPDRAFKPADFMAR